MNFNYKTKKIVCIILAACFAVSILISIAGMFIA